MSKRAGPPQDFASASADPRGSSPTGAGMAFGAVTILNATATGIGCALAIQAPTTATWTWQGAGLQLEGAPDTLLATAVLAVAQVAFAEQRGAVLTVNCPFPPRRGLKTSSSVAAALFRAAAHASARTLSQEEVESLAVEACRRAGITLTGALDDQVAVIRGGCHVTNNLADQILRSIAAPTVQVAIWIPDAEIPKASVRELRVASIAPEISKARTLLEAGDLAGAMTVNGRAFTALYLEAGLPVNPNVAEVALAYGALGAGLSGTGPAVAALFANRIELPTISGGSWMWTEVAP